MDKLNLKSILEKHLKQINNEEGGEKANLIGANLKGADLKGANLTGANLTGADLIEADLDFSCWPLWCGSTKVKVDQRIINQLAYHLAVLEDCPIQLRKALKEYANQFHRVVNGECLEIK
jgi:hypothetical protein